MDKKRKVILVTDGDSVAQRAVEEAARNVGGRCISRSGGNPTPITGNEIVNLVKTAKHDPVVVMVDDMGDSGTAQGEMALYELANHPDIEILGVVAVAANTPGVEGVKVDFSVTSQGQIYRGAVDKQGDKTNDNILYGDTVDIIDKCNNIPIIVGVGDIGKMHGRDNVEIGSPIVTKAMEEILKKNGYTM
ncbi:MAG: stage V sporulation protein AE [Anaeromicrobium sp.]|jgi:stage V sporulation protein AE|uniref:stage V sporulation protein AE n=1 Tax=Anaeromicrobium sp. TaxID=1929132 RepID=UPI0025D2E530|nr:stage V sporulation protein AE [Anaeromicrobium sp.]MCT4593310.1 stage V sporulation protein AE [Anaeromicrobium sp.]